MRLTIAAVVGENVHRLRTEHGFTLDHVATLARAWGSNWNTGRVSRIERGDGALTAETLLLLSLALTSLTDTRVTPADLLTTDNEVELSSGEAIPGHIYHHVFRGELESSGKGDAEDLARLQESASIARMSQHGDRAGTAGALHPDLVPAPVWESALKMYALADERAARKLGMSKKDFITHCLSVWGHLLSIEVEERSEPGDTPQKKGRITRVLMNELREAVNHGND